jgi:hypothetical protein
MRSGVIGCDRNGAVSAALCANHSGTNRRTLRNSTHTCEVWGRCPAPPAAAAPVGEVRSAAPRRAQMVRGTTVTDRRVHGI